MSMHITTALRSIFTSATQSFTHEKIKPNHEKEAQCGNSGVSFALRIEVFLILILMAV